MVTLILQSKASILVLLRQCLPKSQCITLCPSSLPSRNPRGVITLLVLHISSSSLNSLSLLQNLTRPVAGNFLLSCSIFGRELTLLVCTFIAIYWWPFLDFLLSLLFGYDIKIFIIKRPEISRNWLKANNANDWTDCKHYFTIIGLYTTKYQVSQQVLDRNLTRSKLRFSLKLKLVGTLYSIGSSAKTATFHLWCEKGPLD